MGENPKKGSRSYRLPFAPIRVPFAALAVALLAVAAPLAATARATAPPAALFATGHDLCTAASLKAVRKAGGRRYKRGLFVNGTCLWETSDLKAGITLSVHPRASGLSLVRSLLSQDGTNGITARTVRIPAATKAVLVTLPGSATQQLSKDLFAIYPAGVLQLNMTAPHGVTLSRLEAVLAVIAGR